MPIPVRDVFVVRPDGSREKQISDDRNADRSSAGRWAPGAPLLAYVGEEGLMVTDVEQNVRRLLVRADSPAEVVDFSWDPTGQRLAVLFPREVRLYDLHGKLLATWAGPEGRTGVFRALDWSRTGVLATFLKRAGIYATTDTDRLQGWHSLCNFDGSFERCSLRWNPDGSRLLFAGSARGSSTPRQTWLVNADGTNLRPLHPDLSSWESDASWSPDGKMIAYQGPDFSSGVEQEHVYVAALDGSPPRDLTPQGARAAWPTWSPDGTKLAFAVNTEGRWHIYIADVDSGEGRLLTGGPGNDTHPAWSPMWQ
jgi:WD40 repeat protein